MRAIVMGEGAIGTSFAYHLAERGADVAIEPGAVA